MPILIAIFTGFFAKIAFYLLGRLSLNMAMTAAAVATFAAAFIIFKGAMAYIWLAAPSVLPAIVLNSFAMVFPSNTANVIGAIIGVDIIAVGWVQWQKMFGIVSGGMRNSFL